MILPISDLFILKGGDFILASLFASVTPPSVTTDTIMDILTAVTDVFSIQQIVAMIAGLLGVSMAFVFLWWGVRKGSRIIIKAVRSGKFSI